MIFKKKKKIAQLMCFNRKSSKIQTHTFSLGRCVVWGHYLRLGSSCVQLNMAIITLLMYWIFQKRNILMIMRQRECGFYESGDEISRGVFACL